jgi:HAD superfamily hydrolase (TIGR01549 family)
VRCALGRGRQERRVQGAGHELVGAREAHPLSAFAAVVFDLDGTLVDSDEALAAAYVALGVPRDQVTFGHVVTEECARLGLSVADYLAHYDPTLVHPYDGVDDMLQALPLPWAVCSNKVERFGHLELEQLGWTPRVALFAEDFGGGPKRLVPVLDALGCTGPDVIFVGDTDHDAAAAGDVGAVFALACWNPRAAALGGVGDVRLATPRDLLGLL